MTNLLVDTGSEATWIPRGVLSQIGIDSVKKASFRMANGKLIHRDDESQQQASQPRRFM